MDSPEKSRGHYLGTEVDEKWWRRYTKDKLLARGMGKYWFDDTAFYFHRYLTHTPIVIPAKEILNIKTGKWHAGKWVGGKRAVKIIWRKDDKRLSSGFVLARHASETDALVQELLSRYGK